MHTVIVTGVSRGLGEALAVELLARGCRVVGIGRASSARLTGDRYVFVACDMGDIATLRGVVMPAFAAIDAANPEQVCLINNAATLDPVGVLGTVDVAGIASSLTVNLIAPVALTSVFCEAFADDRCERRIINVSSGAAVSTLPGESLYCVAKAGLEMLTRSLAAEQPSQRFRAITLRPGIIDTDMQKFARTQAKERLPTVDLFKGFHDGRQLVAPQVVARKVVERLVLAPVDNGRTYSYAEL